MQPHDASEARLAAIVTSSDDAIISKDLNGIVTSWNRAAEQMFGYTADEAVGQSIFAIIPDDRRGEEEFVLGRIRSGVGLEHYETIRRRKDASLLDVSLTVSPIRVGGTVDRRIEIARDITAAKRLEREAFASPRSSRRPTTRSCQQGSQRLHHDLEPRRPSGCSATPPRKRSARSITILIPEDRLGEETEVLTRIRAGLSVDHYETVRRRKDGSPVDISLTVSPIRDADGVVDRRVEDRARHHRAAAAARDRPKRPAG